jgi:membrane associated rhomboid family serine protease
MQFDVPDPAYTHSARSRARFRLAIRIAIAFVALLWLIDFVNEALDIGPETSGIRPREWAGLPGIVFAPLVHAGFEHLIANSPPLLVLLTTMIFLYPTSTVRVLPAVWLGAGVVVWIIGRESVHFGASGLVYGLASHVFVAGLLRHDRRAVAASLAVWFMYGSLIWGVLPSRDGMSWETHAAGAAIGIVSALLLRRVDVPPRKAYEWEGEGPEEQEEPSS